VAGQDRPFQVGQYQVLERVGEGGMGVVYKARQTNLKRLVALKMLPAHAGTLGGRLARFRAEPVKLASLRHPNIVAIYEFGEEHGCPYFSMEFMEGGSLAQKLAAGPLPSQEAAEAVLLLTRAVHHAHQEHIIHRDLKPANILLTAEGIPKISDFGLAKTLDEEDGQTDPGAVLGTPSYMAPEQAAGQQSKVGKATDVYGLGALLYEMLTGRPPFRGETRQETLQQVLMKEPMRPSRLLPRLPRDLETICLKCLSKEPGERYPNALALAEDLQRFLEGKPILARPTSRVRRVYRWCRRNPGLATASSLAAAAVLALVVFLVLPGPRHSPDPQEARQRATRLFDRGLSHCAQGEVGIGLLWLVRSLEAVPPGAEDLERAIRINLAAWHQEQCALKAVIRQPGEVRSMALSPDGTLILTACGPSAQFYEVATGKMIRRLPRQPDQINVVAFSPDGKRALTACDDGTARLWDVINGKEMGRISRQPCRITSAVISPDGNNILLKLNDFTAWLWTLGGAGKVRLLRGCNCQEILAFSPDGKKVLTTDRELSVQLWDIKAGKMVQSFQGHRFTVRVAGFTSNGQMLLTGDFGNFACLWDVAKGKLVHSFTGFHGPILAVGISPDDQTVVLASADRTVHCYDTRLRKPVQPSLRLSEALTGAVFSPNAMLLLTTGTDGSVRLRQLNHPACGSLFDGDTRDVYRVALSPDGKTALTMRQNKEPWTPGKVQLWDLATRQPVGRPLQQSWAIRAIAFSPDGRQVVTGASDGLAGLWEVRTGRLKGLFRGHTPMKTVQTVAFSPDGKVVLTASLDRTVRLWDPATLRPLMLPLPHPKYVLAAAFSPDGGLVATGCFDHKAYLWDAHTGRPVTAPLPHQGPVQAVAFSPDGKTLLTGSWDTTARLWNARTGQPLGPPLKHDHEVRAVAYSPDGQTVLTGSFDHTARLWDVRTGQPLGPPLDHDNEVRAVAYSPDGRVAITGGWDDTARLWDVDTGKPIGPPRVHPGYVWDVAIDRSGQTLITGCSDGKARVYAMPRPVPGTARDLLLWVEVQCGVTLDDQGRTRLLDADTWQKRRQALQGRAINP
jgi:WD40 repeat protein